MTRTAAGRLTTLNRTAGFDSSIAQSSTLHAKEREILTAIVVQPVEGFPMFVGKLRGDPNHRLGSKRSCVCQRLPEMIMIRAFKLVLNDDIIVGCRVPRENVCRKRPHSNFRVLDLKFESDCLSKPLDIVGMCEPRRKVRRFAGPQQRGSTGRRVPKEDSFMVHQVQRSLVRQYRRWSRTLADSCILSSGPGVQHRAVGLR